MSDRSILEIALRAYTEPLRGPRRAKRLKKSRRGRLQEHQADMFRPVLILDFETTVDPSQRLLFGALRLCRWEQQRLVCVLEAIIHADELTEHDLATIRDYARTHTLTTGADQSLADSAPTLRLTPARECARMIYRACHEPGPEPAAALVGFNLNFDISRLAVHWGSSTTKKYANGFTLQLAENYLNKAGQPRENAKLFPRYGVKHLSSTKALRGWIAPFSGHMIDVRQLMFARPTAATR